MLPSGYLQVEYIAGTGTQYINSNYAPKSDNVVYETAWMETTLNSGTTLFGCQGPSSAMNRFSGTHYKPSTTEMYSATGTTDALCRLGGITANTVNTQTTTINNGSITRVQNGVSSTASYGGTIKTSYNIYLFANNITGTASQIMKNTRLYYWRMTDNGVLVRDMIPAERVSDGAVGMYDRVEGVFYANAGSGAFAKGKYVVGEDEIVKLEYIESSGTQYINTEFKPNQDSRVYAECVFPAASSTQGLFGARTSSSANQFQFVTSGNYYRSDYNTTPANVTNVSFGANKFFVDKNKNLFDLNGQYSYTHTYASFSCSGPMYIFATNNNGAVYGQCAARIYMLKAYDNGNLVRDYYPAQIAANGTIGLWDAVSGMMYTNAGTGTFIEGPEIPTQLPAPQNLRATSVTADAITIEWDSVEKAVGYKVFRNYAPMGETETLSFADFGPQPYNGYIYVVVAFNEDMQSAPSTVRVASVGGEPVADLITDRTQEDVDRVLALVRKGLNGMTEEERVAFVSGMKGAYNAVDLNRVEGAVAYLPGFLNGLQKVIDDYLASVGVAKDTLFRVPYDTPVAALETQHDWSIVDIPRKNEFSRYLANIATARGWLPLPASVPAAPDSIDRLTYDKANAIERILLAIYNEALKYKDEKLVLADRAKGAWRYCGTFDCGQEVIF